MGNGQSTTTNERTYISDTDWDFFESDSNFSNHPDNKEDWGHFGIGDQPISSTASVELPRELPREQPEIPPIMSPFPQPTNLPALSSEQSEDDEEDLDLPRLSLPSIPQQTQTRTENQTENQTEEENKPKGFLQSLFGTKNNETTEESTPEFNDFKTRTEDDTSMASLPPDFRQRYAQTLPVTRDTNKPLPEEYLDPADISSAERSSLEAFSRQLGNNSNSNVAVTEQIQSVTQPSQVVTQPYGQPLVQSIRNQLSDNELDDLLRLSRQELQRKCANDSRINTLICAQNLDMNYFWMKKTIYDRTRNISPTKVPGFEGFKPTDDWLLINFLKSSGVEFKSMKDLTNMTRLDLSGNRPDVRKISRLPYRGLNLLQYDSESGTQKSLPWSSLKSLDLSHNDLSDFPSTGLGNFPKLEELDLRNNDFRSFPLELGNVPNLKKVYLGGNPSTSVTETHLAKYPKVDFIFKADLGENKQQQQEQTGVIDATIRDIISA